jgi:hypothetical protein
MPCHRIQPRVRPLRSNILFTILVLRLITRSENLPRNQKYVHTNIDVKQNVVELFRMFISYRGLEYGTVGIICSEQELHLGLSKVAYLGCVHHHSCAIPQR